MDDKLAEHFGQDGKIIKEIFDPDTEGTPLNRLKATLHDEIAEIQAKIMEQKGRKMEARKGNTKRHRIRRFLPAFLGRHSKSVFRYYGINRGYHDYRQHEQKG